MSPEDTLGGSPASAARPDVPLNQVDKPDSPEIVGSWILLKNLWIILRYRIPHALTYGLNGVFRRPGIPSRA